MLNLAPSDNPGEECISSSQPKALWGGTQLLLSSQEQDLEVREGAGIIIWVQPMPALYSVLESPVKRRAEEPGYRLGGGCLASLEAQ